MKEIELKLTLASEAVDAFCDDTLLRQISLQPPKTEHLDNQYFDTPDLLLNQSHAALRIRKTPTHYVQTLKNKGTAIAGLHQRGEWETPLTVAQGQTPQLDWDALPAEARPDEAVRARIQPLFKTDFQRTTWLVSHKQSEIELVLDQGHISRDDRHTALCEIELELKSGNAIDLFDLAALLAERYPLVPCDVNKAERGYQLLNPKLSFFTPHQVAQAGTLTEREAFALLSDALSRISRRWDSFVYTRNWWLLVIIQRQINGVAALLDLIDASPELSTTWRALSGQFDALLKSAQVSIGLFVDRNNHSLGLSQRILQLIDGDLENRLKQFITQNHLGSAILQLGHFLFSQQRDFDEHNAIALPALPTLEISDSKPIENQLTQLSQLQAFAYLYQRLEHPAYQTLNAYVDQLLIATGMRQANQMLPSLQDRDSRAKLASWTRRLTVELRALQDLQKSLTHCA